MSTEVSVEKTAIKSEPSHLSSSKSPWGAMSMATAVGAALLTAGCAAGVLQESPHGLTNLDPRNKSEGKSYPLPGNGEVSVFQPFGKEIYVAVAVTHGTYPEAGKVAHDVNREEFILVLDGKFDITLNGNKYELNRDEHLIVRDGDKYSIKGKGRCVVLVKDGPGGTSKVE